MRTSIKTLLVLLSTFCFGQVVSAQQALRGAFILTAGKYGNEPVNASRHQQEQVTKLFADGYWISSFVNRADGKLKGTGGGSFVTTGSAYKERLMFYSWDSTAVGKQFDFTYTLVNKEYHQKGYINSDKYKNYLIEEHFREAEAETTLQHSGLEGAWWMEQANFHDGRLGEGRYAQAASLKLYVYPRFATAMFNKATGQFLGATGGTYQYDGDTLIEVIDYATWGIPRGEKLSIKIKMKGGDYYEQQGDNSKEVWKRLKNNP